MSLRQEGREDQVQKGDACNRNRTKSLKTIEERQNTIFNELIRTKALVNNTILCHPVELVVQFI